MESKRRTGEDMKAKLVAQTVGLRPPAAAEDKGSGRVGPVHFHLLCLTAQRTESCSSSSFPCQPCVRTALAKVGRASPLPACARFPFFLFLISAPLPSSRWLLGPSSPWFLISFQLLLFQSWLGAPEPPVSFSPGPLFQGPALNDVTQLCDFLSTCARDSQGY